MQYILMQVAKLICVMPNCERNEWYESEVNGERLDNTTMITMRPNIKSLIAETQWVRNNAFFLLDHA